MSDFPVEADQDDVVDDTAGEGFDEDHTYGTLEEAAAALGDDEDEAEPEEQVGEEDPEGEEEAAAAVITLSDGTALTLEEVEKGVLRQADYTRKTTELAREREQVTAFQSALNERAQTVNQASQKLVELVHMLIPPEPAAALAQQNPGEYVRQKAMREAALNEISGFLSVKDQAGEAVQSLTQEQLQHQKRAEDERLVKAMPKLKDPAALAKFEADVKSTAKGFGFDDAVIDATTDHRVRMAMYYAGIGMRAVQNQAAAKRRVAVPQPGKPPAAAAPVDQNKKAMRRLIQTGSFQDALKLNF